MEVALFTQDELNERIRAIRAIKTTEEDYYPSVDELYRYTAQNPTKYIDFLLWLYVSKRNLSPEQEKTRQHVENTLRMMIRTFPDEESKKSFKKAHKTKNLAGV